MTCDEYYHLRSVSVPITPPPPPTRYSADDTPGAAQNYFRKTSSLAIFSNRVIRMVLGDGISDRTFFFQQLRPVFMIKKRI